jgi:hypothetical protein
MMKKLLSLVLVAFLALSTLPAQKALIVSNGSPLQETELRTREEALKGGAMPSREAALQVKAMSRSHEDAALIDATLKEMGWEVHKYSNLDEESFKPSISKFAAALEKDEPALVFFSGEAIQIDGNNYLVPQGKFESEEHIVKVAPELNWLLSELSAASVRMVFLDAARSPENLHFKPQEAGLTGIEKVAGNTLLMYSSPLNTIQPDQDAKNNFLAQALAKEIQVPNLELKTLADKIAVQMGILHGGKTPPVPYSVSTIEEGWTLNKVEEGEAESKRIYRSVPVLRKPIDGGVAPSF